MKYSLVSYLWDFGHLAVSVSPYCFLPLANRILALDSLSLFIVSFATKWVPLKFLCMFHIILWLFGSLHFSIYKIMSFKNRNSFTLFFSIWMLFFSLSCIITMTRIFRTVLNRSGESHHLCLVSDIRRAFSLSLLNIMLAVGFSERLCQVGTSFFYLYFIECFYCERVLDFVKYYFRVYCDIVFPSL